MADATYQPKTYREQGGDRHVIASGGSFDVESGGELDIESGGALKIAGTDKTTALAAAVATPVAGVAASYKLARSAAPVALDGSNPTTVASGLTTIVSAGACLSGTAAPGLGTSTLSVAISGTNLNIYGWAPTGAGDTTLVASTGTESFHWWAIGT